MSLLLPYDYDKDLDMWMDREVTTSEAILCAREIEGQVIQAVLVKPRSLDGMIRDYMVVHCQGTTTTRPEFAEAVRHILEGRWGRG